MQRDNKEAGVVSIKEDGSLHSVDTLNRDDVEVGSIDYHNTHYIDSLLERKIARKLDFRILPVVAIMYLFNALDKGNISNAKTDGIDVQLGITGYKWNLMLSVFYIPFVLCALPLAMLIKKYNAANCLPMLVFGFGSISLLAASAFNFGSLLTARLFLGCMEAPILPALVYYLTTFYPRAKLGSRISIFYSASAIANSFSGLLSYGCFQINSSRLRGWQILFIIEGGCSIIFAVLAYFLLPRSLETANFLTEEEKKYAMYRIKTDSSDVVTTHKISFKDSIVVFKNPVVIAWMMVEICIGVPLNSINNWFPQIVGVLGKSTVQTNLYTVAPNIWGAVVLVALCFLSDHFKIRSIFVCFAVLCTLVGFLVFGVIETQKHLGVAYFSCFLMTMGASASSVLTSTWYTNNTPNANRRAVISAVGVPLANAAGLISTNIFRPQDAPKYVPALGITAGFGGLAIVIILSMTSFMVFDNRRRNKIQGVNNTYQDVPTSELSEGPDNINFRWMY